MELVSHVERIGGATIAAHPFRKNNRGIKKPLHRASGDLRQLKPLTGTRWRKTIRWLWNWHRNRGIPVTGASDAHTLERIGCYATEFQDTIRSLSDLTLALQQKDYVPVRYTGIPRSFERLL